MYIIFFFGGGGGGGGGQLKFVYMLVDFFPRRQICSKSTSMLEAGRDACRTLRLHLLGI